VASTTITARLAMVSVQAGCTSALVFLTLGLYLRNRWAGLAAVWVTWLVAPLVRRIFFLSEPIEAADPLALAPFLVTGMVAALEYQQVELSRRARRLLLLVVLGYSIGIPLGLLRAPSSALFATFAYLSAAGCFVIGYRDADAPRRLSLPTVLMLAMPVVALYAFRQYFFDLPEWDQVWYEEAEINSAGSPDEGRVRVWGALNSPGTFALVLAVSTLALITARRVTPFHLAAAAAVLGALALTYVRSAWLGLVVAVLVIVVVTRGAALRRVAPLVLTLAVLGPVTFGGSVGTALGERVNSFGTLESDESAQARVETPARLVPLALSSPLGLGIGRAGEPARLSPGGGFRYTDNGYLSLIFQVGPFGFLLVMAALVMALRSAWRVAWRRRADADVLVLSVLAFIGVALFAGDAFYGIGGMIIWYMAGVAVRREEGVA